MGNAIFPPIPNTAHRQPQRTQESRDGAARACASSPEQRRLLSRRVWQRWGLRCSWSSQQLQHGRTSQLREDKPSPSPCSLRKHRAEKGSAQTQTSSLLSGLLAISCSAIRCVLCHRISNEELRVHEVSGASLGCAGHHPAQQLLRAPCCQPSRALDVPGLVSWGASLQLPFSFICFSYRKYLKQEENPQFTVVPSAAVHRDGSPHGAVPNSPL